MWKLITDFVEKIFGGFNNLLKDWIGFDDKILGLYDQFIAPQPEIFKILGAVFVGIILVLGVMSFVKKMLKLFIVIAVILGIVLLLSQF
ncbi:MAG: hypothetical protein RBT45_00905 [Acholeplasmataceae bacterium]|jgi:hypothetical protein|nr:hypothetical protein [Acholeplasmataceae bacterium]